MVQTYTESLLNDGNAHDGHSYRLYQVLTQNAWTYIGSLLNDGSASDSRSYILYPVLTLTTNPYNLHRTLVLTTKRHYRDTEMNHLGARSDNSEVILITVDSAS